MHNKSMRKINSYGIKKKLNLITKISLAEGLLLIIYGYLCRQIGLYFFWESKSIGWAFLFIGIIGILFERIKFKKTIKKNSMLEKIAMGIIIFILVVQSVLISIIPFTDAYSVAKTYIISNDKIKSEVGNIVDFGLIPIGGIEKSIGSKGETGNATICLTVKGDKKYMDIDVYVIKEARSPKWKVIESNYIIKNRQSPVSSELLRKQVWQCIVAYKFLIFA